MLICNAKLNYSHSLLTSFSKGNFRICSIPIILYSENETKSVALNGGFNAIIKKNESGNHKYFLTECERQIRSWRRMVYSDLEVLELKLEELTNLQKSDFFNKYYFPKISKNSEYYFANKTKIVSNEFIKAPTPLNYDWILLNGQKNRTSNLRLHWYL